LEQLDGFGFAGRKHQHGGQQDEISEGGFHDVLCYFIRLKTYSL
jgi:hypothetical protein